MQQRLVCLINMFLKSQYWAVYARSDISHSLCSVLFTMVYSNVGRFGHILKHWKLRCLVEISIRFSGKLSFLVYADQPQKCDIFDFSFLCLVDSSLNSLVSFFFLPLLDVYYLFHLNFSLVTKVLY